MARMFSGQSEPQSSTRSVGPPIRSEVPGKWAGNAVWTVGFPACLRDQYPRLGTGMWNFFAVLSERNIRNAELGSDDCHRSRPLVPPRVACLRRRRRLLGRQKIVAPNCQLIPARVPRRNLPTVRRESAVKRGRRTTVLVTDVRSWPDHCNQIDPKSISGNCSRVFSTSTAEHEDICGSLLPKLLPNSVVKAGTETDSERPKMQEVPMKWDFLGKNKTRRDTGQGISRPVP
jgi:hypothetical protein